MAKKSTNTEETKQSTVVLNDDVNPIQDPIQNDPANSESDTLEDISEDTTQDPTKDSTNSGSDTPEEASPSDGDCSNPGHTCTCKPGHCPNKDCKAGNYWTKGDKTVQYLYHYNTDDETTPDETMVNPIYEAPAPSTPSDNCGPEVAEPWAHDELLQDADGHTGLERELRLHCGVTYDVIKMWLNEIATATDKDAVIDKIAWHIPTGGPNSIKVHHKAKIVEALKALK